MFSKSIFIIGLLALFACQRATATSLNEVEKLSLSELIDKVKEVLGGLEQLVGGVISDALGTLGSLASTLTELKDKYLQGGIDTVKDSVGTVIQFIKDASEKAAEVGVDISECVAGQDVGLENLSEKLIGELTTCVTTTANGVLTTVQNEVQKVQDIVANVTSLPSKLSKCLITLRPIACLTDLLKDLSSLLTTIPQQILTIVNDATSLVNGLPTQLLTCVNNIAGVAVSATTNIIADIAVCVEDKMNSEGKGTNAITRLSVGELIEQIKEVIANLKDLVSGVIGDAIITLTNLVSSIANIKDQFLGEGIAAITGGIGNAIEFIKNKTQEAAELGVDITKCIIGREEQLEQLATGLTANLTDCVTGVVGQALIMVNNDLKIVNDIVANVTNIPKQLSKCIISLRPLTCLTNLLGDITTMLSHLPEQILGIVNEAKKLVEALPEQLLGCVNNISSSTISQTDAIVSEIGSCVDNAISAEQKEQFLERLSVGELVEQIREVIKNLKNLVSGTIGDALATLVNLVSRIAELKDKFLEEGISAISGGIGGVIEFIKDKTKEAAELGIDIGQCIIGREEELEQLATGLTANLTGCISGVVEHVITMVNDDIKVVKDVVSNVTNIPLQLSKCVITLKPITCLTNLLNDVSTLLKNLPEQILGIVDNNVRLVEGLTKELVGCVDNIASSIISTTDAIITEIDSCVDKVIPSEIEQNLQRLSISELIQEIKEIIESLNKLVTGVIADAMSTLVNLVTTITEIQEKFIEEGAAAITGGIGNVIEFIKDKTQEAAELGVDITKCIIGREEQLEQLATGLTANMMDCVTGVVGQVLTMVNNDIKIVKDIVANVTNIPKQLTKCIISLRPITCLTNLLQNVGTMLKNLPDQILAIINEANLLVESLPTHLLGCVDSIGSSTISQTDAIISDIGSCVDEAISGATTAAPTEAPTAAPTEAPTAAPTEAPTAAPTEAPTAAPTEAPTAAPTEAPTAAPTEAPTAAPTEAPTAAPTEAPTTASTEAASI